MPRGTSCALLIAAGLLALASCARGPNLSSAVRVEAAPRIDPDYAGIVMPPNIAPLNFRVLEEGSDCVVRISSDGASPVELRCPERQCRMSVKAWRELLSKNKGKSLYYEIFVRKADGAWTQYATITNRVAEEPIDPYIAYRRLTPNNQFTVIKGIFQRDMESFETSPMLTLSPEAGCYNCHTFYQGNPDRFFFHLRGKNGGMVFVRDGRIRKINTQQGPISRPTAFASWNPDGARIVASVNDEYQTFFPSTAKLGDFEASHIRGDLVVYNVETNTLNTSRQVFENGYINTHPCWSADGKWIFYVRCRSQPLPAQKDLDKFRFDLMRISYDTASDTWGTPETLMECSKLGKSCTFPRASPDGRYVLCVLCDRTTFAVYQNSARALLVRPRVEEVAAARRAEQRLRGQLSGLVVERALVRLYEPAARRHQRAAVLRVFRRAGARAQALRPSAGGPRRLRYVHRFVQRRPTGERESDDRPVDACRSGPAARRPRPLPESAERRGIHRNDAARALAHPFTNWGTDTMAVPMYCNPIWQIPDRCSTMYCLEVGCSPGTVEREILSKIVQP